MRKGLSIGSMPRCQLGLEVCITPHEHRVVEQRMAERQPLGSRVATMGDDVQVTRAVTSLQRISHLSSARMVLNALVVA